MNSGMELITHEPRIPEALARAHPIDKDVGKIRSEHRRTDWRVLKKPSPSAIKATDLITRAQASKPLQGDIANRDNARQMKLLIDYRRYILLI